MPPSSLSRRHFVQLAGAGTASAAAVGPLWQPAPAAYATAPDAPDESDGSGGSEGAGPVDRLVLGDEDSERAHGLTTDASQIVTGAHGVPARVATPLEPAAVRGGELRFTLATDPLAQNYLTLKLWGGDASPYVTLAYLNGEQIGYRRNADYQPLSFGFVRPFPGRFWYATTMLPLEMTAGRERVEITLRTYDAGFANPVTENSRAYYAVYTHTAARLDVTDEDLPPAAPPTGTPEAPSDAEQQALIDGFRAAQVALFHRLSDQVDASATGRLSIVRYVDELRFYALALTSPWCPAATAEERRAALHRIFRTIDNHVTDYYGNTRLLLRGGHQGDWGGYYGALGEALYLVENLVADETVLGRDAFDAFLDERFVTGTEEGETSLADVDLDGSPLTRRAAWGRCLKANFDFARSRLSYIYNQVFYTYEGAWEAHEGLRVIGSGWYEGRARSHTILGEALGFLPFLGEEVLVGPDGRDLDLYHSLFYHDTTARFTDDYVQIVGKGLARSKPNADGTVVRRLPYGEHYTGITAAGLTRENTYVGNYGEAARYLGEYFFKTWGHAGDEELNDEILRLTLKNAHARGFTRYPSQDDDGHRLMRIEGVVDERNVYVPGIPAYNGRINEGQSLYLAAVEAHMAVHADRYAGSTWDPYWEYAREAVGFTQQQLADRQYFNQFAGVGANVKADMRLVETWAYLTGGRADHDRFGTVAAGRVLPQTDFGGYTADEIAALGVDPADHERFAWVDVDTMFVSLRDGDLRVFGSLYVQNRGVAGSGRLHVITPTHEHVVQLHTDGPFQYRDYWARNGNIDADFMEDQRTGDDWAPQALAGEILPIAHQPGVGVVERENFEADTPYSGYTDLLTARYGRHLFGINTTRPEHGNERTFELAVPGGHRAGTVHDLVSGRDLRIRDGHVSLPPRTAVVLRLPEGAAERHLPSVVRHVAALPGDGYVGVTWTATAGAAAYTVRRATRESGPYQVVARGVTGRHWRDASVRQDRTYHYTVTAENDAGTGWSSWHVAAGLTAPASRGLAGTGWRDDRLGSQTRGRTSVSGGRITVTRGDGTGLGAGDDYLIATRDIQDSLLFTSRMLTGSCVLTARVDDHRGALSGLMLRDQIAADTRYARYLYFGADADGRLVLRNRDRDSRHDWQDDVRSPRDADVSAFTVAEHPYLRLVRDHSGHQVLAFASGDGDVWAFVGSMLTPFPHAVHAGVAASGEAAFAAVSAREVPDGAPFVHVARRAADEAVVAWTKPHDAVGFTLYRTADAATAAADPSREPAGWDRVIEGTRARSHTESGARDGTRWFKVVAALATGGTAASTHPAVLAPGGGS